MWISFNRPLLLATTVAPPPIVEVLLVHVDGSGPRGENRADVDESVAMLRYHAWGCCLPILPHVGSHRLG